MVEIIPGILEKEFDPIKRNLELVEGLVEWVEIDILDNTLYHNVTYNNWDAYRLYTDTFHFSGHLMVADPAKYVEPLARVGFRRLIADVTGDTVREFLEEARVHGLETGLALDAPTSIEIIEPYLEQTDSVLLMTVPSGSSGQPFVREVLAKIKTIHDSFPHLPIQVDGGIDDKTAPLVIENGATRLISTSYLFWKNRDRIEEAIEELKSGTI